MTKGSEATKGNEHSGSATHSHAHHSHHDEEFLAQVRALQGAEKSAAQKVEDARKEAASIEASARELAVEIGAKAAQKAVEAKNEILSKRRTEADAEIARIQDAVKKQAAAIRAKKLPDSEISALSQSV
jgi:vacuolar-type H+-ATPase subunit H